MKTLYQEVKEIAQIYYLDINSENKRLTKEQIAIFRKNIPWDFTHLYFTPLSEKFLNKFKDQINWTLLSEYQTLDENIIEKFKDKVNWVNICKSHKLSESFIANNKDLVAWSNISQYQRLSEKFIMKFKSYVYWNYIVINQNLSKRFIDNFGKDKSLNNNHYLWDNICKFQELSPELIEKYQDKINWKLIAIYQKLPEPFIIKYKSRLDSYLISRYQILSEEFRSKYDLYIPDTCWLYKSDKYKIDHIKKYTYYEIINDQYIIAYKSVKSDYRSVAKPNFYLYEVGKTYTSHCNCNIDYDNSFGLSAWNKNKALDYHNKGKLLKVKIDIKDIGAITKENKIRCFKLTVLDDISFNI